MRLASPATGPNTMPWEPSGDNDPATREARAWLRRQLAWEHRLVQFRAHAEVTPAASTSTTSRRPHTGVRQ
jgi:hypothetical protein